MSTLAEVIATLIFMRCTMYSDEKGTFILRWAITKNGRRIVAKVKPFKIYITKNK
ncbi:hypothetical protein TOL5_28300 [Acinetobacter sp. Tol 5]|nr:hypothetical protein TOL5_28300 [Acinetobacter sp. Tol 5]